MGFFDRVWRNISRIAEDVWEEVVITYIGGIYGQAYNFIAGFGGGAITNEAIAEAAARRGQREAIDAGIRSLIPNQQIRYPYFGEPQSYTKRGWPFPVSVEAVGVPGAPPEGTFFLCHAPPDMIFDALTLTQSGADLVDDYEIKSGFSARVVQRAPNGEILFISGIETGISQDGIVIREDLRAPAKSPDTFEVDYGGPIEPFLPIFIVLEPVGDLGSVDGIDRLQVQLTATFLVQQVA